jgi:Kef-type K+ transport system membrane component KefB
MKSAILYIASIALAIAGFVFISSHGETRFGQNPSGLVLREEASAVEVLPHLLLALAAVVTAGKLLGLLFRRFGQPPVIGEVVGGILLGPSLLGALAPRAYEYLLPTEVAPTLGVVAQIGVLIYMFLIGLELNPELLRNRLNTTVAISHASIVVPFVLGAALALYLYPRFSPANVPFTGFALFMALAMSITAFPVLARILSDLGITQTSLGTIALTCAAVDDVTAWCLLALVVGIAHASAGTALTIAALTIAFVAVMFFVVRPVATRAVGRLEQGGPTPSALALTLVGLLLSAWTTEMIGIHAIFGAFLFGAIIPHESRLARTLHQNLESLTLLLLPAFFAITGMRTEIGLVSGFYEWMVCLLIIGVATAGKFGGAFLAARLTGSEWRDSAALGILMNTRGLMELIVLNVGLELGVISPTLFTMMVLMALATTLATTPILRRLVTVPLTHPAALPTMTRH